MALTFGFYDSLNHDRLYNAQQMSAIFDGIINDGVFASVGSHFSVVPGTGMHVLVKSGRAWFNSTWTLNDSDIDLTIDAADTLLGRIDTVVLEVNSEQATRANSIKVVKGTAASSPVKPTLTNTATVHQHPLAHVTVAKNTTAITASMIEIVVGKTDCPFVTAILQTTDITNLFAKWENDFQTWFSTVRSTLDGDVALNLQNQIDANWRNTLKDATKTKLGLASDAVPDDAFNALLTETTKVLKPGDMLVSMRNSLGSNWAVCNGYTISPKIKYSELYKNICSRTEGYYIPTLTMDTVFDSSTHDVLTTSLDDSSGVYYFVVAYYQEKTIRIYAYDPFADTRTLCGTLIYDSTTTASWSFGKDSYRAATAVSKLGGGHLFASLYATNDNDTNQSTKYQVLWIWYKIGTSTINHKWSGELTYQSNNLTLNMVGPLLEYTGDGFVELLLQNSTTYTPYVKFPIESGSINANNWTYDIIRSGGFSYPSSCWSSCWSSGENRMYFGMYNTSGSSYVRVYYFDWSTKTISSCTMGYTSDTSTISPLIKIDGGIYMLGSHYGYSIANGVASLLYNKTTIDDDVDLNVFAVRKKDNKYYFLTCRLPGPTSNSTYGSIRVSDTFAGIYNKESTRITSGTVGYMLSMKSDAEFYLADYGTSGYPIAMLPPAKVSYSSAAVNPGQVVGSFVYIPNISLTHETNSSVPEIITTARYFVKLED